MLEKIFDFVLLLSILFSRNTLVKLLHNKFKQPGKHISRLEIDLFCDTFRKRAHSIGNSNAVSENMVFGELHFSFGRVAYIRATLLLRTVIKAG